MLLEAWRVRHSSTTIYAQFLLAAAFFFRIRPSESLYTDLVNDKYPMPESIPISWNRIGSDVLGFRTPFLLGKLSSAPRFLANTPQATSLPYSRPPF